MENSPAFAWSSLLLFWGIFLNQTDSYFLFYPASWRNNSAGGFRKNISGLSLFFKGKRCPLIFWVPRVPKDCFDVARHCHGWEYHCWLQLVNLCCSGNSLCLSHTHPRVLQPGLLRTRDWGQHRAPCLLHLCFASWLILLFVLLLLATWHHVWEFGFDFWLLFF